MTNDPTPISEDEFNENLRSFQRTAFRLEQQPAYNEPTEDGLLEAFVAGSPVDPLTVPACVDWYANLRALSGAGKTMSRVRIQDDPPTDYQRWELWQGQWNAEAGEQIHYLDRAEAIQIGLLPAAGNTDWWLLDDERLMVMHFDQKHRRVRTELITDDQAIEQAQRWRDLALRHARPVPVGVAPAQGAHH